MYPACLFGFKVDFPVPCQTVLVARLRIAALITLLIKWAQTKFSAAKSKAGGRNDVGRSVPENRKRSQEHPHLENGSRGAQAKCWPEHHALGWDPRNA